MGHQLPPPPNTPAASGPLYAAKPSPAFAIPMTIATLGLYRFWYRRTSYEIFADRLVVAQGLAGRSEEELPLSKITGVTLKLSLSMGTSKVIAGTGSGERTVVVGRLNRKAARAFAQALNAARANASA